MKVFVVGGAVGYANFLEDAQLVENIKDAEVVLFTGGEDVTPALYGCKKLRKTFCNTKRDLFEKEVFESVDPSKQICLGICRGSQFLCVMNGGKLVQHCYNHALYTTHGIMDEDTCYQITSTHHQMQYPYNLDEKDYKVLFISDERRSGDYEGEGFDKEIIRDEGEPEIVEYHKKGLPRCLAVQGHPEMIPTSPVAKMISNLVKEMCNDIK